MDEIIKSAVRPVHPLAKCQILFSITCILYRLNDIRQLSKTHPQRYIVVYNNSQNTSRAIKVKEEGNKMKYTD